MATTSSNHFLFIIISFLCPVLLLTSAGTLTLPPTKTYIIHVAPPPSPLLTSETWHLSFFAYPTSLLYSYKHAASAFAARLTADELAAVKAKPGFLRADVDFLVPLATTHTPEFLGLRRWHQPAGGLWNDSNFGNGVIVAVLDTGVLPNHPSFNESGMAPPPAKWKGKCEFNVSGACNNKLIGARAFLQGIEAMGIPTTTSPIDTAGHGTHTSSTSTGRFVDNASALGQAVGTAIGMAPEAHLAVYKICTEFGCAGSDILAGLDAAIEEGADVLSLSLGGSSLPFDQDPIAVGTFSAVEKGIFVSLAAGNDGPEMGTVSNEAPWMLTVGASTMDRVIETSVKLGNGEEYKGKSVYQTDSISTKLLPLVYPGASGKSLAKFCFNNSLDVDVKGKIVICDRGGGMGRIQQGDVVKGAGGAGMILAAGETDGYTTVADAHVLPACHVNFLDATKIKSYINSTSSPTATILPHGTVIGDAGGELSAPMVAAFSSRGMSQQSKGILKPDIIGPGVDVLAGWPALPIGPFDSPSLFNVISGTSMATPHLSGIAALLKSANPSWSPAAIKSAIMTTAENENLAGKPIANEQLESADLFARGAGHVNPSKANNPGFVYDIDPSEYITYMCGLNYSDTQVSAVARRIVNCSTADRTFGVELNYPTFSVELKAESSRKLSRKAKNVGERSSSYVVEISPPTGVAVAVSPTTLTFKERGEELSYTVEFNRDGSKQTANYTEGYLRWISSDKTISVRSPILIHLLHV